jgi:hypothetical protein
VIDGLGETDGEGDVEVDSSGVRVPAVRVALTRRRLVILVQLALSWADSDRDRVPAVTSDVTVILKVSVWLLLPTVNECSSEPLVLWVWVIEPTSEDAEVVDDTSVDGVALREGVYSYEAL